jgi:hypothetical protein
MPRKEFDAFTRLDASDVNTYLMDQSVMTFASSAARGSAIATPVEGMVTYLEDSNDLSLYNGSAWVPLPVGSGGTGATTLTSGGYLKGAGTSAITSQTGIPAGDITSGSLASARLPAGSILQVVTATSSTSIISTSTSFITSGLTAVITPRATSSRILCLVSVPVQNNSSSTASIYTLFRGTVAGTNLGSASNPTFAGFGQAYNASSQVRAIASWNFVDSPNTTSETRYTVGFNPQSGGAEVMQEGRLGSLTLMEIAG